MKVGKKRQSYNYTLKLEFIDHHKISSKPSNLKCKKGQDGNTGRNEFVNNIRFGKTQRDSAQATRLPSRCFFFSFYTSSR